MADATTLTNVFAFSANESRIAVDGALVLGAVFMGAVAVAVPQILLTWTSRMSARGHVNARIAALPPLALVLMIGALLATGGAAIGLGFLMFMGIIMNFQNEVQGFLTSLPMLSQAIAWGGIMAFILVSLGLGMVVPWMAASRLFRALALSMLQHGTAMAGDTAADSTGHDRLERLGRFAGMAATGTEAESTLQPLAR